MKDAARKLEPSEYPSLLREIPDMPDALWLRGSLPPPDAKMLAVVGSRALSAYGRQACDKLIAGLTGYPISIVSGLALGADAAAHEAALRAGLHAIAIPGSGIDDAAIAPRTNLSLAHRILSAGGALLSEHPPTTVAQPGYFPSRNRIMAGISHATLVIEAGEKSGTLITARLAVDYNRDLLCLPHRIGDAHGFGAHLFIRLGAILVSDASHILEALGIPASDHAKNDEALPRHSLSAQEERIFALLEEPMARDELIRKAGMTAGAILTALMALELKGFIKEEFGAWRRA